MVYVILLYPGGCAAGGCPAGMIHGVGGWRRDMESRRFTASAVGRVHGTPRAERGQGEQREQDRAQAVRATTRNHEACMIGIVIITIKR